jgi:hypothetical protein
MKKMYFLLLVLSCFVSKSYSQDWTTYNSTEGKFSVSLPAQPTIQTDTSKTSPYYVTKVFLARSGAEMFLVGWVDYPESYKFDEQKELEENRDNFIKAINGSLVETKNTAFRGYKAIEFKATSGAWTWTSKVFLVGKRPYQMVAGSNSGKTPENENKFYDSFFIKN